MSSRPTLNSPMLHFVDPAYQPLDGTIHTNSTGCYDGPYRECTMPLAVIAGTEYSDYFGSVRERSNHRALLADETIAPYVVQLIGSHGYQALAYPAYLGPVPLCEPLANNMQLLANGEAIDEDDENNLEAELEGAAWEDSGRADFRKALCDLLDDLDPEHEHDVSAETELAECTDEAIDELWRVGCAAYNTNGGTGYKIETGGSVHFYLDEWVKRAKDMPKREDRVQRPRPRRVVADTLAELAKLTRCK